METKEKTPSGRKPASGQKTPMKKHPPASGAAGAPRKPRKNPEQAARKSQDSRTQAPAAEGRSPSAVEEARRKQGRPGARPAAGKSAGKNVGKSGTSAPPRKTGNTGRGKAPKSAEGGYQPYRKANNRRKAARNRDFARKITTFFSYQNPILKLFSKPEPDVFGDGGAEARKQAEKEARRRRRAAELKTPAIIYTQPKAFNRSRFVVQLLTVLAVVLAMVMGMSVFFKVKVITVSGANVYSAWTIRENSGIKVGDNLLTFGRTRASGQIIANLPYVRSARIGIKLPDTVNIEIEEEAVVYAIQDFDGVWWLINSNGKIVEQTSAANAKNYTKVTGVTIYGPQPGAQCVATENVPPTTEEGTAPGSEEATEEVPVTVTGASQLNAALHILQCLEANDQVGTAASVDVTRLDDIILWYGTQYQVNLGNTQNMEYKIACMVSVILQMSDYQTGILDISFTTWRDQVGYTPFG